jgi:ABC-2 type transport system permease protein
LGLLQPVPALAVAVFVLTLGWACGLGFALVGLVLVYKRIGGGVHLLWQLPVFFTGALALILNPLLKAFSKLLPLTLGITCLREIIIHGATRAALWQNGLLSGLLVNTAYYLILGAALFTWDQRRACQLDMLAHESINNQHRCGTFSALKSNATS